jgi:phage minor structural protein
LINIYDSKETNFSNNGLCILDPIVKSAIITEEINGQYILDIEVTKDTKEKYKYINEFCIIKADGQLFRLYNLSNLQDRGITIRATLHHIYKDVDTDFLDDISITNGTVCNALESVILDSRFTILPTDIASTATINFVKDKPLNAIFKTILPTFGGELIRDNFNIGIVSKIGKETGLSIEYSKNITGFEQTLDYSEIVTRMMPTGKDGATIDLINGGSKWITSPRINNYFKTFSSEVTFDNLEDATELKVAGEALWDTIDLPKVNYKVNFVELERTEQYKYFYEYLNFKGLELGDSVIIKHKVFNTNLTARVIKIVRDGLTGKTLEIELGEFRDNIFNAFDKIDYKIASVGSKLEETKKALYTKVTQTDERITLEATRIDEAQAQLSIQADQISTKVTAGQVSSIITQSATEVAFAFNEVARNVVVISEQGLTVNNGGITINGGSFTSPHISGGTISAGTIIACEFQGAVDFSNCTVLGLDHSGYITLGYLYNSVIPNLSQVGHTHSQYADANYVQTTFNGIANFLTSLDARVIALENK